MKDRKLSEKNRNNKKEASGLLEQINKTPKFFNNHVFIEWPQ